MELFHPKEKRNVIGVVNKIDLLKERIKVDNEWLRIWDIEGAKVEE